MFSVHLILAGIEGYRMLKQIQAEIGHMADEDKCRTSMVKLHSWMLSTGEYTEGRDAAFSILGHSSISV